MIEEYLIIVGYTCLVLKSVKSTPRSAVARFMHIQKFYTYVPMHLFMYLSTFGCCAITGDHSKYDQILLVKTGKYKGFCVTVVGPIYDGLP